MSYNIICNNSLIWLSEQKDHSLSSFLTGLPDMNEVSMDRNRYINFFENCANLIFTKMSKKGYAIFIQTDRKIDGEWIDKSYILTDIAKKNNVKLMWHKIVLQRDVNSIHLQRPTYSHILCYSYMSKPGKCTADVLPIGKKEYENSTPQNASDFCAKFLADYYSPPLTSPPLPPLTSPPLTSPLPLSSINVIDPFVGRGTTAKSCCLLGLSFLGIDIDKEQCDKCIKYLSNNL